MHGKAIDYEKKNPIMSKEFKFTTFCHNFDVAVVECCLCTKNYL